MYFLHHTTVYFEIFHIITRTCQSVIGYQECYRYNIKTKHFIIVINQLSSIFELV